MGDGFTVEAEAGGAVDVGAEGADFGGFERFEDLLAGMAVAVVEATGDDGPLRGDAGEEFGTRGGDAAVMAYFEQSARKAGLGQHGLLDGGFGVAFEHHGRGAVGHVQDQRVVVGGFGAGLVVAEGREDGDLGCSEGEGVAGAERAQADVEIGGLVEQGVVGAEAGVVAHP